MKRLAIILGCVILVAAIAYPVFGWGPGWGKGHHMMGDDRGPGYHWQGGQDYGSLPQEQRTQLDSLHQNFYDDTAALRNEIRAKSGELDTLLNTSNPDPERLVFPTEKGQKGFEEWVGLEKGSGQVAVGGWKSRVVFTDIRIMGTVAKN